MRSSVLYVGQFFIERRLGRGFSRAEQMTMRGRWLAVGHGGPGDVGGTA